ncbi:MAG: PASTA domain-containing protein [Phycisphaeraceae bacterium]|nr:PASTA domain-containing protein [Phycisphaeraceae bacterium]
MSHADDPQQLMDELSAPVGDLIANIGRGLAEAQQAIDAQTIENFHRVYAARENELESLREIGYRPTWYHIPEMAAEMNIALSVSGQRQTSASSGSRVSKRPMRIYAAPVDATYSNKYEYNMQASSKLSFKIVPVPPSSEVERRAVVPAVEGKTLKLARSILEEVGIDYELDRPNAGAETMVLGQEPEAGTLLAEDGKVMLKTRQS